MTRFLFSSGANRDSRSKLKDPAGFSLEAEPAGSLVLMAEPTGLEPATSDVTGRRSNQLNYDSARSIADFQLPIAD
jgi:hypothetical protein